MNNDYRAIVGTTTRIMISVFLSSVRKSRYSVMFTIIRLKICSKTTIELIRRL